MLLLNFQTSKTTEYAYRNIKCFLTIKEAYSKMEQKLPKMYLAQGDLINFLSNNH